MQSEGKLVSQNLSDLFQKVDQSLSLGDIDGSVKEKTIIVAKQQIIRVLESIQSNFIRVDYDEIE